MKYKYILPIIASSLMILSSCDDNLMEWGKDPDHGEVTGAELPLALVEKISRYEPLKNYSPFPLGNGIGISMYMSDETYRKIVNENFDEVTPGYEMKHGAMVNSKGEINFTNVDAFIAATKSAGLKVFGHTLIWHSNQSAGYLNSIIAPTVIPGSSGANILDLTPVKNGSFTGWARYNAGKGINVIDNEGLVPGTKAIQLMSSSTSSQPYNLQLISPDVAINAAHNYELSFYVKSDVAGKGRISFDASLVNPYPYKDWYNTGSETDGFATSSQWKQVKIKLKPTDFVAGSTKFKFNIDLGYLPNVNYLIDVNTLAVVDLDASTAVVNMISNGNFENGSLGSWGGWGNGSTRTISAKGEGYSSDYAMVLTNPKVAENYNAQQVYTLSTPLEQGVEYSFSFMVKSTAAASLQVEAQGANYNADYYGGISVTTGWTQVTKTIVPSKADRDKIIFDFGADAVTYYIDDIVLSKKAASGGGPTAPITIEKTEAEKAKIIADAMTDWISKMMTHYKTSVFAWDVVNEPMKEDGTLRNGTEGDTAADYFSWVKYLGKDYAVSAFKLARQYGNETDKLFINDYNLESRLDKCEGLIKYVEYIENQGAKVDGIGTQMHIGLNTDKEKIVQMFQKLAASGKLIKISELDVRLGTKTPTVAQQASQAEMYQYVIDMYRQHIPTAQQYGITIWGVSDHPKEHEYWLPDESPNLWDANYVRKHAYKGTADGLAGKDVSKDFSGELVK